MNKKNYINVKGLHFILSTAILIFSAGCNHGSDSKVAESPLVKSDVSCYDTVGLLPEPSETWLDYPERFNIEADILALESTLNFSSSDDIYQQTLNDLATIRSDFSFDPLVSMAVTPCYVFSDLLISFDDETAADVRSGIYEDWLSLNERYGVDEIRELGSLGIFVLHFQRRYYTPTLVELYSQQALIGVNFLEGNGIFGESQDICLEQLDDKSRIYIFREGVGDCASGCPGGNFSGYRINPDDSIDHLGEFSTSEGVTPEWFSRREPCLAFLQGM